jgi:lysophospholipase L1-like esterase
MYFSSLRLAVASVCALVAVVLCAPASAGAIQTMPNDGRLLHVIDRLAAHRPVRIIAFGSSSTEGIGASSPAATYPSRLQAALAARWPSRQPVVVLNRGVGGQDADDMALRLPAIIGEHPDLIIWQTGSNDPLRGVPLDRFEQLTTEGIQQIRAAKIDVMLLEPQLCRELDNKPVSVEYRDALRAIGEAMDVTVIRRYHLMRMWLADGVLTPAQMLSPDGLHMADGGYAKLAEAIAGDILHGTESPRVAMDAAQHH